MLRSTRLLTVVASAALLLGIASATTAPSAAGLAPGDDVTVTNTDPAAVDGTSLTRAVTVADDGAVVTDVDVTVVASRSFDGCPQANAGSTLPAETFYRLTSPEGTTVRLVRTYAGQEPGRRDATYSDRDEFGSSIEDAEVKTITFDDEAGADAGPEWASGTFRPSEPLDAFDGEDTAGTWSLEVGDSASQQSLCHQSFTLDLETAEAACFDATATFERVKQKMRNAKERVARARESGDRDRVQRAIAHKREVRQERIAAKAAFFEACAPR